MWKTNKPDDWWSPEAERKRIMSQAFGMYDVLRELQWSGRNEETDFCPMCGNTPREKHTPGCEVGEVMRAIEEPPQ